ncbi:probable phytol kinase, chloroplastic isoform X2 [Dendrobium catenatum]|uniref:phytol kinase n=1 Tax=Dendrobium catenatum TaxID=906689 RepID=A0A2I0W8H8_9ASPA|nr:probable phytol kinase, chloroplastic isoform X2 [Dendrobium catenatum]PKU71952.1 Phytol kinase 1, chloroplastic [Dendrobium catenatum]
MEFPLIVSSPPVRSTDHRLLKESIIFHHSSAILFPSLVHPQFAGKCARIGRSRLLSTYATSDSVASMVTILRDGGSAALVMVGGYSLVRAFDSLTMRNVIEQSLSRKIVHVLSGLLYMASWPMFSSSSEARYFAALVPLLNSIRLIIYGLSIVTDESLIKSVTREGKSKELLRGPLYYVLVLLFSSLFFWRESPIGIILVAMMSGGDGFADILGRRYGSLKLPHNRKKSWIGSISMFIFGFIFSIMMLYYFSAFGYFHLDWRTVEKVVLVSLAATIAESLPISQVIDDNITVPIISTLAACLVFGN